MSKYKVWSLDNIKQEINKLEKLSNFKLDTDVEILINNRLRKSLGICWYKYVNRKTKQRMKQNIQMDTLKNGETMILNQEVVESNSIREMNLHTLKSIIKRLVYNAINVEKYMIYATWLLEVKLKNITNALI